MYTTDTTTQLVIAMLKAYNIRNIVASPGTRDADFVASIQNDSFFNIYSVVDERSAGYFALGLSYELNEPVVITCTGATASRNYLSALTEAYYRHLPLIAITCGNEMANPYNLTPQYVDRSISQNDIKKFSVTLPSVCNEQTKIDCELFLNIALTKATTKGCAPVHINLLSVKNNFTCNQLPAVNKIDFYSSDDLYNKNKISLLAEELVNKKIGVFIGSHNQMSSNLQGAIEKFIDSYDCVVFCDHTSNYYGKNKILIGQATDIKHIKELPDIIIDIGGICGHYSSRDLFDNGIIWRISEDGEIKQRYKCVRKFFDCKEETFFLNISKFSNKNKKSTFYARIVEEIGEIVTNDIPFSNTYIASIFSDKIPKNSSLHIAILNSLRNCNFFNIKNNVYCTSNVGGFGIDGALSTFIGQSMANSQRLYYCYCGDLAFFYDMNILGNRHINNNIRILLVNNGTGVEFKISPWLDEAIGSKNLDSYIAAKGHNGSAKGWAESMGFHYICAKNKSEFNNRINEFCSSQINAFGKPVIFEVFTTDENEINALKYIRKVNSDGNNFYPHAMYQGNGSMGYDINAAKNKKYPKVIVKAVSSLIPSKQTRRNFRKKYI